MAAPQQITFTEKLEEDDAAAISFIAKFKLNFCHTQHCIPTQSWCT